jgi:hypothetical protein
VTQGFNAEVAEKAARFSIIHNTFDVHRRQIAILNPTALRTSRIQNKCNIVKMTEDERTLFEAQGSHHKAHFAYENRSFGKPPFKNLRTFEIASLARSLEQVQHDCYARKQYFSYSGKALIVFLWAIVGSSLNYQRYA